MNKPTLFFPVLSFIFVLLSIQSYSQYTEKQIKRLHKMDIKAAIYEQKVNEPSISRILVLRRQQPKLLVPAIVLSTISAVLLSYGIDYAQKNRGSDVKAVEAASIAFGAGTGVASLALFTISLVKKRERNKLIKQLKN